ncbi:peptidase M23 [Sphingomonas sp. Leaf24]|uniref:M23 family metallopeptidase n=1 Tax=unclassified Sphingomonas TaxID=196159 RepID=UPI0007007CAD|nr:MULTISPECIES: M23 family metallopeptidase [unclassified Sphingomonas]KQM18124.1 peptidase M23 [Sphingomonas sp. Leaf5]KQM89105.1 peptidase M23 [Sphingomonas sp. Leaf24]
MSITSVLKNNDAPFAGFRSIFRTRQFLVHDGGQLRRHTITGRNQIAAAGLAAVTIAFSAFGMSQAATGAVATSDEKVVSMQQQVDAMRADVARLHADARAHAARLDKRQAALAAVLTGDEDADTLAMAALDQAPATGVNFVTRPFERVARQQATMATHAKAIADARYSDATRTLRKLGLNPRRVLPAMGGPYEPVDAATAAAATAASATADAQADAQFRALFLSWKKLDTLEQAAISIPSYQPVERLSFTSNFGVRSDPFRGTAAMHAGVDIPGPIGTPVYATADGIIARAERAGGYGNLIEVNHGKGIATRYGHLSKIIVHDSQRVRRGQLIGLMGSTGRSTGSHLHYEVRIDGSAVNPAPYLQAGELAMAADRAQRQRVAMGGPVAD